MGKEQNLEGLQRLSLRKAELQKKWWYVPKALSLVCEALERNEDRNLLAIGCGRGNDAFLYADIFNCQAVGVDVNEQSIREAKRIAAQGGPEVEALEPVFLVADITEKGIARKLLNKELGPFDIATLVGTMGSLVTEKQVLRSLENTRNLLKPNGKLVISDFGWWKSKEKNENWWEERYCRDESALRLFGITGNIFGTIVIRPKGFRKKDLLSLSPYQVSQALEEKDFERLVRHWQIAQMKQFLEKTGFTILRENRKLGYWKVLEPAEGTEEKDFLLNYQILAQRVG